MTFQTLPWSTQGQTHPAEIARSAQAAAMGVPVGTHTAAVASMTAGGGHGVIDDPDLAVTQLGSPAMKVNVATGAAFIRAGGARVKGTYAVYNDATVEVTIASSDPTNPRIDLIIVHVPDTNYGDASNVPVAIAVQGTPAGSPAVPSLAAYANCLVLAQVAVAAAVSTILTANITDKRTFAAAIGGTMRGPAAAPPTGASLRAGLRFFERDTYKTKQYGVSAMEHIGDRIICTTANRPTGARLHDGLEIFDTDLKSILVYYAAAGVWRLPWTMPWGLVASTLQQTTLTVMAAGIGTTEGLTNITTPAFDTIANRNYRVTLAGELRAGHNLTAYGSLRIRRGITTGGTIVLGPTGTSKKAGAGARDFISVSAVDVPGASAGQRYCLTFQTDASTVDFYGPAQATLEDIGPSSATPA